MNTTTSFYINHIRAAVEVYARQTGTAEVTVVPSHIDYRLGAMGYAEAEDLAVIDQIERIARLVEQDRDLVNQVNNLREEMRALGFSRDMVW